MVGEDHEKLSGEGYTVSGSKNSQI